MGFDHNEFALSKSETDFWGQVRRTVNGVPVDGEQIDLIVASIRGNINISDEDWVIDLACGNGALGSLFAGEAHQYFGVDLSPRLIEIAEKYFHARNKHFTLDDAESFLISFPDKNLITKLVCYGSFSYFSRGSAKSIIEILCRGYPNLSEVYIGNLPNRDLAHKFYPEMPAIEELDDHTSPIGIWRSKSEFKALLAATSWDIKFIEQPDSFYASAYRYDVLLSRAHLRTPRL